MASETLPDARWPVYIRRWDQGNPYPRPQGRPMQSANIMSFVYDVPAAGAGHEKHIVCGGFNFWMDWNCCGSVTMSSAQASVYTIGAQWDRKAADWGTGEGVYGPTMRMPFHGGNIFPISDGHKPLPALRHPKDKVPAFSIANVMGENSCVLRVRDFDPDFPELTIAEAKTWGMRVCAAGIAGCMNRTGRSLWHGVDVQDGMLSKVLELVPRFSGQQQRFGSLTVCGPAILSPWASRDAAGPNEGYDMSEMYREDGTLPNIHVRLGETVRNPHSGNMIQTMELINAAGTRLKLNKEEKLPTREIAYTRLVERNRRTINAMCDRRYSYFTNIDLWIN